MVKANLMLIFSTNTNRETVAYQSFRFWNFKLEVSEKLPQGQLDCGSQLFIATLLFGFLILDIPIFSSQKCPIVGLFAH